MIVCVLGVSWAIYIRMWQIVLWEEHCEAIQSKLTNGYTLVPLRWRTEIRCENAEGECVRWRGGLTGETVED